MSDISEQLNKLVELKNAGHQWTAAPPSACNTSVTSFEERPMVDYAAAQDEVRADHEITRSGAIKGIVK